MNDAINRLITKYPDWKETLDFIAQLQQTTRQFPFPEFFEPAVAIEIVEGKPTILSVSSDLLAAWISHMSYGTRARMEALEDAILASLADGNLLIPAILTRCHLEVAGWAAYANQILIRFSEKHDYEVLKADILHTAYSSALIKKDDPSTVGRIPGAYAPPRNVMNAVDALQEFFDVVLKKDTLNIRHLYDFLCDFGHPAIMGLRAFVRSQEKPGRGWLHQYARGEDIDPDDTANLLMALLWGMRAGHTNAALMHCGEIIEEQNGGFTYQKPDLSSGAAIWEEFLQGPPPSHRAAHESQ